MSMESQAKTTPQSDEGDQLSLVDCDVHPYHVPDEIDEYLPAEYEDYGFEVPHGNWSNPHDGFRGDAKPETGGIPGSDPELLRQHVIEENGTDYPILTAAGVLLLAASPQFDYAHALSKAFNDWLIDKWLDFDDRFVGAIAVAPQQPDKAAEMIREYGDHPQVRQVIMGSATEHPLGRKFYWPIYEACEEMGLPMAVHPGSVGHGICPPPTGAGYPTTFFESHVDAACHYISNLISLVAEGVFTEFSDFEWVWLEGGFTWAPSAMWRMDQNWKRGKEEVPHLEKPPSEYVREHCYFGTQPIPEPDDWDDLRRTIEIMHGEDTLVYCSDYPHWDTDDKDHGIPRLPDEIEEGMYYGNAQELYDLPSDGSGLR